MRPLKRPMILTLLLLAFALCLLAACSVNKNEPVLDRENETTEINTETEQVEEKPKPSPRIGPLLIDPVSRIDTSGVFLIGEEVSVFVEAPGADRVEFYAALATDQSLGTLFWDDDHAENGWGTHWEPPFAGEIFRLTAIAFYNGKTVQSSAYLLWPKEMTEPAVVEIVNPFTQISTQSVIKVVEGLPRYFQSAGWIDEQTFFGLAGTTPVVHNMETGESFYPGVTAWGAKLAPQGDYFAYNREDGIYMARIDGAASRRLWPTETAGTPEGEGYFGGGLWSPAGDKLLVWWEHEWDSEFFICDLQGGEVNKINTRLDGYFLTTATGWADEQNIVFTTRANMKKDGTREYTFGYRANLAVFNLETLSYKLISDTGDGEFLEGLAAGPAGIFFLHWFSDRNNSSYGVMDRSGRAIWQEPSGQAVDFFLAPDGKTVACLVETGRQQMNIVYELVIRTQGVADRSILEMKMANHIMPQIFWHPEGEKLLFTFITTAPQEDVPDSYQERYYTLVIKP